MWPYIHFIVSLIIVIFIYPEFGINSLLVFLTGFLIDIDHLLYNIFKHKDLDFINLYKRYGFSILKDYEVYIMRD